MFFSLLSLHPLPSSSPQRHHHHLLLQPNLHLAIRIACSTNPHRRVSQSPNNSHPCLFYLPAFNAPQCSPCTGKLGGIYFSASVLRRFSRAPADSALDAADELRSEDYFSPPPFCCVRLVGEEEAQVLRRRGANADRGPIVLASETQGTERAGVCRYRSGGGGGGEGERGGDNNPGRGGLQAQITFINFINSKCGGI